MTRFATYLQNVNDFWTRQTGRLPLPGDAVVRASPHHLTRIRDAGDGIQYACAGCHIRFDTGSAAALHVVAEGLR